jgi:hypothetical protein
MAVEKGPKLDWSAFAGADLSTKQYTLVKWSGTASADEVVAVAGATDKPLGVLNNAPKQGEEADVAISGVVKVLLGGTVARDADIGAKADGTLIAATVTGTYIVGRALEAGVSGQIISAVISTATIAAHA